MALRGRRYVLLAILITALIALVLLRREPFQRARDLLVNRYRPPPRHMPDLNWTPPPIKNPFPTLSGTGASPPQIPIWNRPKKKLYKKYGLDYAPPLLIGFTRAWPVLLQAVVSYLTAGWPADQIWIVDNTGASRANAAGRLTLQNPLFLDHGLLRRLGVRVLSTPVLMTFAQLQNYYTHLAHVHGWPWYFWSHMDVLVLSYEEGLQGVTPAAGETGYKTVYELCLAELQLRRKESLRWSSVFFSYDHLTLVNREAYDDVGGWDVFIPYYMNDCDMHSRLMMRNWSQPEARAGIITDVSTVLDDLRALYRDPDVEPAFTDPNPPKPDPDPSQDDDDDDNEQALNETRHQKRADPQSADPQSYFQRLKTVADSMFHYKHGERGRNTWQLGQHGGQGEPFYYPARGLAEATDVLTEAGREVFRRKWGHKDCDLIDGGKRGFDDQWRVEKDW